MYLLAICNIFFGEVSLQVLGSLFIRLFLVLLNYRSSSYTEYPSPNWYITAEYILQEIFCRPLILQMHRNFLIFMKSNLSIFVAGWTSGVMCKKLLQNPVLQSFFLCFLHSSLQYCFACLVVFWDFIRNFSWIFLFLQKKITRILIETIINI